MDGNKYVINTIRQDIVEHNLNIKAIIQDINACAGPLADLHELNSAGRAKIAAIRKHIDKLGDIAKENKDKDLLQEVVLQREQLSSSMEAFRKANIKAMLAIERSNKEELLKASSEEAATGAAVRQRQKRDKAGLVKMSTNITDQLLTISRQLADTTQRSADTLDTLATSSTSVQGTQDELLGTSSTISQSGKLLAKYGRREFTDKVLLFFAFAFFLACVLMKSVQVFILLATLVAVVLVCTCDGAASPFLYSLYPVAPQNSRRSRPQRRNRERGGRARYNEICRVHAGGNLAFPGRIGNPVCPW